MLAISWGAEGGGRVVKTKTGTNYHPSYFFLSACQVPDVYRQFISINKL